MPNEPGFAVEPLLKDGVLRHPLGLKLKYIHSFEDRIGTKRYYFRHGKYRRALPDPGPGVYPSAEFMKAYAACELEKGVTVPAKVSDGEEPRCSPTKRGYVYFLRVDETVKIGFSTNPSGRLMSIRTGLAGRVRSFVFIQGEQQTEQRLQKLFRGYRTAGEWFRMSPSLGRLMAHCAAYGKLPDQLFSHPEQTIVSRQIGEAA